VKPKICVSLATENPSNLPNLIQKAEKAEADLIEIRLDYLNINSSRAAEILKDLIKDTSVPTIATNRQYEQGGRRPQDEDDRIRFLIQAAEVGFEYIDLELTVNELKPIVEKIKSYGAKPIISFHNFKDTPSLQEMEKTIKLEIDSKAEICKLVTTARNINDNVKCLLLARKMSRLTKIVCFAMGRKGLISRVLSPIFGGFFTFSSLGKDVKTAPGQLSIEELKSLYVKLGVYE